MSYDPYDDPEYAAGMVAAAKKMKALGLPVNISDFPPGLIDDDDELAPYVTSSTTDDLLSGYGQDLSEQPKSSRFHPPPKGLTPKKSGTSKRREDNTKI